MSRPTVSINTSYFYHESILFPYFELIQSCKNVADGLLESLLSVLGRLDIETNKLLVLPLVAKVPTLEERAVFRD